MALLTARVLWTRELLFTFLAWNLFLAWVPVLLAWPRPDEGGGWRRAARFGAWLLFFPNAPYLVTDFAHLGPNGLPRQVDVALLAAFAWAGLLAGCVSLAWMQRRVERRHGRRVGRAFVAFACALAGFGIALGRNLRFNSWDVITAPGALLRSVADLIVHPGAHFESWSVAGLFGALTFVVYALVEPGRDAPADPADQAAAGVSA